MSLSLPQIVHHEFRLSWCDWSWFFYRRTFRLWRTALWSLVFFAFLQAVAAAIIASVPPEMLLPGKKSFLLVTASAFLAFMMMTSQAMEQVTRAFYSRADLDLILSSPVSSGRIFAVRIAAIMLSTVTTALFATFPFINALVFFHGPRWLSSYGVVLAMAMVGTAFAVALTVLLFRLCGAKRTRLISQITAAIMGSIFVIGLQSAATFSMGTVSRFTYLTSPPVMAMALPESSPLWLPARAMMGDLAALALVLLPSALLLLLTMALFAPRFGYYAVIAAGSATSRRGSSASRPFRAATPRQTLIAKEWKLILRDPWLVSQTLLQLLYLIPPALLMWRNFGNEQTTLLIIAPLLVMVAGQLSGGISWLAISGEDAPELMATAPLRSKDILSAKRQAVLLGVGLVILPMMLALGFVSPFVGALTFALALIAAAASAQIQLWFRAQAKRSQFRRRQTSSRTATFAEAFSSIFWASSAAFAAAHSLFAIPPMILALIVLLIARAIRPKEA